MKILKYLIKPLKIIIFLCVVVAVIYYRSIIFHPNVSHKIDMADSYIEEKLKITIPEHYSENSQAVITNLNSPAAGLNGSSEPVVASAEGEANVTKDDTSVIEQASGVSDEADLDNTDSAIDKMVDESVAANNQSEKVSDLEANTSRSNIAVEKDFHDQFSETLDMINKKVDMLFNLQESKPVEVPARVSDARAAEQKPGESSKSVALMENQNDSLNETNTETSSADAQFADADKILHMARKSFWNGDPRASEKLYLDLVSIEDTNPDLYGELGNVYYSQGKWKKAGAAYYEAAIRLLAMKQDGQVGYLLRVIQGLDADKAEQLRQKMNG